MHIQDAANTLSLKLEGRFTAEAAENTRTLVTRCHDGMQLVVDLTEVTFIDSVGEEVLSFLAGSGQSSWPKHPIAWTYVSACIFALRGGKHWIRTLQGLFPKNGSTLVTHPSAGK